MHTGQFCILQHRSNFIPRHCRAVPIHSSGVNSKSAVSAFHPGQKSGSGTCRIRYLVVYIVSLNANHYASDSHKDIVSNASYLGESDVR